MNGAAIAFKQANPRNLAFNLVKQRQPARSSASLDERGEPRSEVFPIAGDQNLVPHLTLLIQQDSNGKSHIPLQGPAHMTFLHPKSAINPRRKRWPKVEDRRVVEERYEVVVFAHDPIRHIVRVQPRVAGGASTGCRMRVLPTRGGGGRRGRRRYWRKVRRVGRCSQPRGMGSPERRQPVDHPVPRHRLNLVLRDLQHFGEELSHLEESDDSMAESDDPNGVIDPKDQDDDQRQAGEPGNTMGDHDCGQVVGGPEDRVVDTAEDEDGEPDDEAGRQEYDELVEPDDVDTLADIVGVDFLKVPVEVGYIDPTVQRALPGRANFASARVQPTRAAFRRAMRGKRS